ncbi:DUF5996 family protein [Hymenobacter sp.]|uniref:DUF5996 family protein n=1 Tax=Hymenobacter sp. TaxID=1898978 RepID=UPI00286BE118|nr:DUF5996 family protein [Hymenobacter sp.]
MNQPVNSWPSLPADSWTDTRLTLHRWTQMVGKTRLALSPMLNHWWQVVLYVTPRGLTTGPMPYAAGSCEIVFDFRAHQLQLHTDDGQTHQLALEPCSVAEFYRRYQFLLREAGISVKIWPVPVEVADITPFGQDYHHRSYDARAVEAFWDIMLRVDQVLSEFRSPFLGKCSPVHFFWGSFDMAVTRFTGRPAPPHPGGVLHEAPWVTQEAYSAEQCSAGWWPGSDDQESAFYCYHYPGLPTLTEANIKPSAAYFSAEHGEFLLPYEAVRTAANPRQDALDFLQSTYEAAATLAHWNRAALERA